MLLSFILIDSDGHSYGIQTKSPKDPSVITTSLTIFHVVSVDKHLKGIIINFPFLIWYEIKVIH